MSDGLARLYTKELTDRFGQPFILEFKPGAATNYRCRTQLPATARRIDGGGITRGDA